MAEPVRPNLCLNHLEIMERMTREGEWRLTVTPLLHLLSQLGPSSLDVRLGTEFRVFLRQKYPFLDPLAPSDLMESVLEEYAPLVHVASTPRPGQFVLHPGEFALGSTLEYVEIPADLAARLEGRSSWGRIGLQIHSTAGYIDPGYKGTITFELGNVGKVPLVLYPGLRVAQLGFFPVRPVLSPYDSKRKYQLQVGPANSRFYKDPEFAVLRSGGKMDASPRDIEAAIRAALASNLESRPENELWFRLGTQLIAVGETDMGVEFGYPDVDSVLRKGREWAASVEAGLRRAICADSGTQDWVDVVIKSTNVAEQFAHVARVLAGSADLNQVDPDLVATLAGLLLKKGLAKFCEAGLSG